MFGNNKPSCIWEKSPVHLVPDVIFDHELEHLVEKFGTLGWSVYDIRDTVNRDGYFSSERKREELIKEIDMELAGFEYRIISVQTKLADKIHSEPEQIAILIRQDAA